MVSQGWPPIANVLIRSRVTVVRRIPLLRHVRRDLAGRGDIVVSVVFHNRYIGEPSPLCHPKTPTRTKYVELAVRTRNVFATPQNMTISAQAASATHTKGTGEYG